jgi:methylmalonyl-CoA mutase N-terminal domain/subunit
MLDGVLAGIDEGWFQGAIADSAYEFEKAVGSGERAIVGVNKYASEDHEELDILRISDEVERSQRSRVAAVRQARDEAAVTSALEVLVEGARGEANLMPLMIGAARVRATEGEIAAALKGVFGGYREPPRV